MTRTRRLADGTVIRLVPGVRRGHRVLMGGAPTRVVRLSEAADALLGGGALLDGDALTVRDATTARLAEQLVDAGLAMPDLADVRPADFTVVIPVCDGAQHLRRALAALAGATVVVVDDASRDAEAIAGVAREHGARLIRLPRNVGPAAARNRALEHVETDLIAFVDCDVEVTADDLGQLTRHFADPKVAAVGPRIDGAPGQGRWFETYDQDNSALSLGRHAALVRPATAVGWLPSACLVVRADALGDGFDAGMRVGEDVDLIWRLVGDGYLVRYDPSVVAVHQTRPTARAWAARRFVYGTSAGPLARRHRTHMVPADMRAPAAVAACGLLARSRVGAGVALAAAGWAVWDADRSLRGTTVEATQRRRLAAQVAGRSVAGAVDQQSALLLKHWAPWTLVAAVFSRRARRMLVTALVVDVARRPVGLVARRVADGAYGAGVTWGALTSRTVRPLVPRIRWPKRASVPSRR